MTQPKLEEALKCVEEFILRYTQGFSKAWQSWKSIRNHIKTLEAEAGKLTTTLFEVRTECARKNNALTLSNKKLESELAQTKLMHKAQEHQDIGRLKKELAQAKESHELTDTRYTSLKGYSERLELQIESLKSDLKAAREALNVCRELRDLDRLKALKAVVLP